MSNTNKTNIYGNINILNSMEINGTAYLSQISHGFNEYYFYGYDQCVNHWENTYSDYPLAVSSDDLSWRLNHSLSNWSNGILSKKRFIRNGFLSLDFEAKTDGYAPSMIGFVSGSSSNFNYSQTPSRLIYFSNTTALNIYENSSNKGSFSAYACGNVWRRYKIRLINNFCEYYFFNVDKWILFYTSSISFTDRYFRILVSHYSGSVNFKNMMVYDERDYRFTGSIGICIPGWSTSYQRDVPYISYINIESISNANLFGYVNATKYGTFAVSNGTNNRGLEGGGSRHTDYPCFATYYAINISTASDSSFVGNLSDSKYAPFFLSNGTNNRGLVGGGEKSGTNTTATVLYLNIVSDIISTSFGNSIREKNFGGGTSNTTGERGIVFGGAGNPWLTAFNEIEYYTISTPGNATDFGDMLAIKYQNGACSNATNNRGVKFGGTDTASTYYSGIEYVTITTPGNSVSFGSLLAANSANTATSNGTSERGVCMGGASSSTVTVNIIQYITINSTGNSADFGDLITDNSTVSGMSNA